MLSIVQLKTKGRLRIKYGTRTIADLSGSDQHYWVFSRVAGDTYGLLVAEGKTSETAAATFEVWLRRTYPERC